MKSERRELWAIVLAGGEGTRMARLTEAIHGRAIPKQYAALLGDRTFLQETVARVTPLVPSHRTMVAVSAAHEGLAREQLAGSGVEIVVQPRSRGTGPGLLFPLLHVLDRAPDARVVVFPADHHFDCAEVFLAAVRRAIAAAEVAPARVALVGAEADHAATDFGWIVPGPVRAEGTALVETFVEKPPREVARHLLERGGLWNTLVVAAHGQALWRLGLAHLPQQASLLELWRRQRHRPTAASLLADLYREMKSGDLCRDVFERTTGLGVTAMSGAGWSDCGTPERLVGCLFGKPEMDRLRRRLELGGRCLVDRCGWPAAGFVH